MLSFFNPPKRSKAQPINPYKAIFDALNKVMACIEFTPQGRVLDANPLFLNLMGYELSEIVGQEHKIFVPDDLHDSRDYQAFWQKLAQGEPFQDRFSRKTKSGAIVCIEATYNPILNQYGQVEKVIKFATDITAQVQKDLEIQAKMESLDKVMAIIEFTPAGKVLNANQIFCETMGYSPADLSALHHSAFVLANYAKSSEYAEFWQDLAQGEAKKAIYERVSKSGKTVWLDASYNPVRDTNGKVVKVIKFASDITAEETSRHELENAVHTFSEVMHAMANGDLTQSVNHKSFSGDLQILQNAINHSVAKIKETVQMVSQAAHSVQNSAVEVNDGSVNLNERVQRQASALEEASATMTQMASQVQSTSENLNNTSNVALQVEHSVNSGLGIMSQTIEAMRSIQDSSSKITEIVTLIDSIAFQTNLLALNAAVEAARAGEHGRGFAVVASEVRALAQKSADAAKDIKGLIDETVLRVDHGASLSSQSGDMLNEINQSIHSVTQMIGEMASASTEQAEGIRQMHLAITEIDNVTQENAALVEETSASAEDLTQQADTLKHSMSFFRT